MAVLVGLAIPMAAFGRSLLAVFLLPALLVTLATLGDGRNWRPLVRLARRPPALALWLRFALWTISVAGSLDPQKSAVVWTRSLIYAPAAVLLATRLSAEPWLQGLIHRIVLASTICVQLLIVVLVAFDLSVIELLFPFKDGRIQANMVFKAQASAFACLLPVLLWAGWRLRGIWRPMAVASVPLTLWVIWGDGGQPSRAALGGLVIGAALSALAYALSRVGTRLRIALSTVLVIAGGLLAVQVFTDLPRPPASEQAYRSMQDGILDPHRLLIWRFTLEKAMEKPVFGHGIDVINRVEGASEIIPFVNQEFIPSHPHSWLLEILAETGIVGLAAMLLALAALLHRLFAYATHGRDPAAGWAAIALFGVFWGSSLANFSIWAVWWQVSFWLPLAILLAANLRLPTQDGRPPEN